MQALVTREEKELQRHRFNDTLHLLVAFETHFTHVRKMCATTKRHKQKNNKTKQHEQTIKAINIYWRNV